MRAEGKAKLLGTFALATTIGLFLVLVMGALVTDTGSAQGCGHSWPLCNGQFVPAFAIHTLVEFTHRAVSGIVGLMVGALAIWAWRATARHPRRTEVRFLACVGALFVLVQALLGAAAVLWQQSSAVLALHFGFSLLAFVGVLLLTVLLRQPEPAARRLAPPATFTHLAWATLAYVYGLVYLGAYVAHSGSALACSDWPLCNGRLLPPLHGAVGIQFAHRLAALGAMLLIAWLFIQARPLRRSRPDLYRGAHAALALVLLQALSGAMAVLTRVSLTSQLLHSTLVACLFGALGYLCLQLIPQTRASRAPARVGLAAGRLTQP